MSTALATIEHVREELLPMKADFAAMLPAHITPDRFTQIIITALERDPSLLEADRHSLFVSAKEAANDGLVPDKKEGAFVVYNTKVKVPAQGNQPAKEAWIKSVKWMPMIYGIRKKMFQTGEVKDIQVELVHENDVYRRAAGDDAAIVHEPLDFGDRGKVKGGYAIITLKNGGVFREVMSLEQIEAVAKVSKSDTVWAGPFRTEMMRKTILRRLAKQVPLSAEVERVLGRDDALYDMDRVAVIPSGFLPGGERHRAVKQLSAHELLDDKPLKVAEKEPEESTHASQPDDENAEGRPEVAAFVTKIRHAETLEDLLALVVTLTGEVEEAKYTTDETKWLAETVEASITRLGGTVMRNVPYATSIERAIAARPPSKARRARRPKAVKEQEKTHLPDAEPLNGGDGAPEPGQSGSDAAPEPGAGEAEAAAPAAEDQGAEALPPALGGILSSEKGPQTWDDPNFWLSDLLNKLNALKGDPAKVFWKKNLPYIEFARDHGFEAHARKLLKVGADRGFYVEGE